MPDNRRVMGYPVQIEHKRYLRNSLLYNVCLVFSPNEPHVEIYKPVVQKLAETFQALEVEGGYLYHDDRKERLLGLLPRIRAELNEQHQCFIPVGDANAIALRVFSHLPSPGSVNLHDSSIPLISPQIPKVCLLVSLPLGES